MKAYNALVALNADNRFGPYEPGNRIFTASRLFVTVVAESVPDALEKIFTWGNKMPADGIGGPGYPPEVRSVSVGDVVSIREFGEKKTTHWAVGRFGWDQIDEPTATVCETAAKVTGAMRRVEETI